MTDAREVLQDHLRRVGDLGITICDHPTGVIIVACMDGRPVGVSTVPLSSLLDMTAEGIGEAVLDAANAIEKRVRGVGNAADALRNFHRDGPRDSEGVTP